MPEAIDDYVHRIGRTGRVGNRGLATSFFNDLDFHLLEDLVEVLKEAGQTPPDWMEESAKEARDERIRSRYKPKDKNAYAEALGLTYRYPEKQNKGYNKSRGRGGDSNFSSSGGAFDDQFTPSGNASTDMW